MNPKNRIKGILCLLCALVLLLGGLAGCGSAAKAPDQSDSRQVSGKELKPNSSAGGVTPAPATPTVEPTQIAINTPEPTDTPEPPVDTLPPDVEGNYTSTRYGFTFDLPEGWFFDPDSSSESLKMELFKGPTDGAYPMYPNVTANVILQTYAGFNPSMLDAIIEESITQLGNTYSDFFLYDSGAWFLSGNEARMIYYSVTQYGVDLELMQIIGYSGDTMVIWTYGAMPVEFDEYIEGFYEILETFYL